MATRAASSRPQNASSTTITSRGQRAEPEPGPAPQTPSRQSRRRKPGKGRAPPPAPQPKTNPESASQSSSDPELPMRAFERKLALNGARCIVGVDEAGRGPLAGPVIAAAVHVPLALDNEPGALKWLERIVDSKKLAESDREELFDWLTSTPSVKYATGKVDAADIDEMNILQATMRAMHECVCDVECQPDHVLVDGNRLPWGHEAGVRQDGTVRPADPPQPGRFVAHPIVRGDSKVLAVAAASVIAKVTRDRIMRDLDIQYPGYGLATHKGYPTATHIDAIRRRGPTAIHRMTFAPLKNMPMRSQRGPVTPRKKRPASPTAAVDAAPAETPRGKRARRRLKLEETPHFGS
eukprot:m.129303 g.129303  ORF g.129303 m.129303 type:complete len:351 (+) comp13671_c0_seq1:180-1232(+)